MTDEQANQLLDEMEKEFGVIPNPTYHPKQFEYYLKLHLFKKELQRYKPQ